MVESGRKSIALVSGVGRAEGIGFEVCRQLARRGLTVLLTARDLAKADRLAAGLVGEGLDVRPYALDIASSESPGRLAAEVTSAFGRLDVLVNNAAGFAPWGETASTADLQVARAVMDVTLFGTWRVCQAFLPLLRASAAGRIVNVSSGAGSHGDPVFGIGSNNNMGPSYAVSKAALNALTVKLAVDLRGTDILVNAVCPGLTATFPGGAEMGARPVPEGAAGIVWAATLPPGGPTGGFFRDGQPLPW